MIETCGFTPEALGRTEPSITYNPAVPWLTSLLGTTILRLPSKLWLLVAMGASLMAGVGLHGLIQNGAARRLQRSLLVLAGLMGGGTVLLLLGRNVVTTLMLGWMPERIPDAFAAAHGASPEREFVISRGWPSVRDISTYCHAFRRRPRGMMEDMTTT